MSVILKEQKNVPKSKFKSIKPNITEDLKQLKIQLFGPKQVTEISSKSTQYPNSLASLVEVKSVNVFFYETYRPRSSR